MKVLAYGEKGKGYQGRGLSQAKGGVTIEVRSVTIARRRRASK